MSIKAIWVERLAGSWPRWNLYRAYGIQRIAVDIRDGDSDTNHGQNYKDLGALIDGIHAQGFEAEVYVSPNWPGFDLTGGSFASKVSSALTAARVNTKQCGVLFNNEGEWVRNFSWQRDFWTWWRNTSVRPYRDTRWTIPGMQGGLFQSPDGIALRDLILKTGHPSKIVPWAYLGNPEMAGISADHVVADLVAYGWPVGLINVMLDAKTVTTPAMYELHKDKLYWWDNYLFTDGRLTPA